MKSCIWTFPAKQSSEPAAQTVHNIILCCHVNISKLSSSIALLLIPRELLWLRTGIEAAVNTKADIGFDECQMHIGGNRCNFIRTWGCVKAQRDSGFKQCSFGKFCILIICPHLSFRRQGRLVIAVAAERSSVMTDGCDSNADCSC